MFSPFFFEILDGWNDVGFLDPLFFYFEIEKKMVRTWELGVFGVTLPYIVVGNCCSHHS